MGKTVDEILDEMETKLEDAFMLFGNAFDVAKELPKDSELTDAQLGRIVRLGEKIDKTVKILDAKISAL